MIFYEQNRPIDISSVLVEGVKEKSMTRGAFTTRAYKLGERLAVSQGCSAAKAKELAKVAYKQAVLFEFEGDLSAGQVHFHAEVDGVAWSCLSPWGATGSEGKWRVPGEPRLLPSLCIRESVIYSSAEVGQIATIIRMCVVCV